MKLISWNVNGIRAVLNKGFMDFLKKENPDFLCLQETKAHDHQVQLNTEGYHQFWHSAEKKGYSGTLILSKKEPFSVQYGLGNFLDDKEGRVLTVEYEDFFLVNVYVPNAQPGLARIKFRQEWNSALTNFVKDLDKKKPVVLCGDMNVAHNEIDLARPKANIGNPGFSDEERADFNTLLNNGFVDIWRHQHPEEEKYSWWSYRANARANNVGWRIDYFLCSKRFVNEIKSSRILNEIMGSDHCPVEIVLK